MRRRYGRPDRASLFAMMGINAVVSVVVLTVALSIFGVRELMPFKLAAMLHTSLHTSEALRWNIIWPQVPGAAIAYGCLWFWLILVGRTRGVAWGGAAVYGLVIALVNVPVAGLLYGLEIGQPVLSMLIMFALLLIYPAWLLTVAVFGITMGLLNGRAAQWWIERHRPRSGE
jgi:hypothetical protein